MYKSRELNDNLKRKFKKAKHNGPCHRHSQVPAYEQIEKCAVIHSEVRLTVMQLTR